MLTPCAGFSLGSGRMYRFGVRWRVVPETTFLLADEQSEGMGDEGPLNALMLRTTVRF